MRYNRSSYVTPLPKGVVFEGAHPLSTSSLIDRVVRLASAAALCTMMLAGALTLASCAHEPEIARPLPEVEESQTDKEQEEADAQKEAEATAEAEAEAKAKAEAEAKAQKEAEAAKKHEGPYVVAIRNGAGADGWAATTQANLEGAGFGADTHTYMVGTYAANGGLLPTTTAFITGEGEDAEDIKAQAEKIIAALGYGTVATYDPAVAGEPMDGMNILLVVGQDSLNL